MTVVVLPVPVFTCTDPEREGGAEAENMRFSLPRDACPPDMLREDNEESELLVE